MLKLIIYYGSWIAVPGLPLLLWATVKWRHPFRLVAALLFLAGCVLSYARFIEPRVLRIIEHEIDLTTDGEPSETLRVALFGDTHIGIFGNAMPTRRIVKAINQQNVDAVFIAGDFTYWQSANELEVDFQALGDLNAPAYAVLGNHDVGFPGPKDISLALTGVLQSASVTLLHNRLEALRAGDATVYLLGTSDLWQGQQDFAPARGIPGDAPLFILTHNPDTALDVPAAIDYDLMLAGHTHGGQIRLPFLYKSQIPTRWPFDRGMHSFPSSTGEKPIYVTSGTGMVGLPMRFLIPPQIDILTVRIPARSTADER